MLANNKGFKIMKKTLLTFTLFFLQKTSLAMGVIEQPFLLPQFFPEDSSRGLSNAADEYPYYAPPMTFKFFVGENKLEAKNYYIDGYEQGQSPFTLTEKNLSAQYSIMRVELDISKEYHFDVNETIKYKPFAEYILEGEQIVGFLISPMRPHYGGKNYPLTQAIKQASQDKPYNLFVTGNHRFYRLDHPNENIERYGLLNVSTNLSLSDLRELNLSSLVLTSAMLYPKAVENYVEMQFIPQLNKNIEKYLLYTDYQQSLQS
jgi:hypothetical protein